MSLARLLAALGVLTAASAGSAVACAICLSAVSVTSGERLDAADRAVLAMPEGDGFRVVAVVKGDIAEGERIPGTALVPEPPTLPADFALLLAHNALADTWTSLGVTDPVNAGWLARIAASDAGERLALVAPRLEDPDPLVAEIAHDLVAESPYAAMAGIVGLVDPRRLRAWTADPGLGSRRATYFLLLGLAGGPEDADAMEAQLAAARQARDAALTAALLAADLELRGPERLTWVEATYLADPARTLPEIEAALLAVSVHGDTDATVPREHVVAAFRRFIRARPAMAGFVAPEFAEWRAWDATADYVALIEAGAVTDPAEEFAILAFLRQSPDPAAKAALGDD